MDYLGLFNYWVFAILLMIGFYAVIAKVNLVKKLIGLSLFQSAVFLLYITMGRIEGGTAPIYQGDVVGGVYANPLPQVLILTAIVVGISTLALGLGGGPRIAVIHASGTIVPGEGGRGATGNSVGSAPLVAALEEAAEDESIRAIVMRIDSPGGSASASDVVWRAIQKAGEKKPVIASLGDVAASGGYYMAAGSDHIVAEPATLTGSIGVVLFKPNLAGLLGWMGIGTDGLSRGRYARIMDTTKGLDRAESALLRTQMNGVYKRFLDRVAVGRGMTTEEVDVIGGGRVWTGLQALERGLVDELGGLEQAVRAAAVEARVEQPESVELVYLPEPQGLLEQLTNLQSGVFAAGLPQPLVAAVDALAPVAGLRPGIHTFSDALPSIR